MAEPAAAPTDDDMLYSSDEEGAGVHANGERVATQAIRTAFRERPTHLCRKVPTDTNPKRAS